MRKAALSAIAGCLVLLLGRAAWGLGSIHVAASGSDAGSGEETDPVQTIRMGISLAGADSEATLQVVAGVYEQPVEIRKGSGKMVLHGAHHENEPKAERHTILKSFVHVDRRPVTIENFVIQGPKDATEALVHLSNAREVTVSNCAISTGGPALAVSRCAKVRIENCTFVGHGSVVSIDGCDEVVLIGCTMVSSQYLQAQYGYLGKWSLMASFYGLSAADCGSLTLTNCAVQAPQRAGNALWLSRVGKLEADGNRYWGMFTTGADGPRTARTIEDWRELSGRDAASRMVRLEYVPDPLYGCLPDPRSVWGGEPNVTVPVPRDSVVSIGIFDGRGAQARTLANEYETRDATELKLHWDGSNNLRIPVPPAEYRLRVFRRDWAVRQSWIGNSGGSDDFVQPAIEDLCLVPGKGFLVAHSTFQDAAKQAGAYSVDGKALHSFPDLGGWGRSGGDRVAASDQYVFLACPQTYAEGAGDRSPPKNETWDCVRRYRADGSFAPWPQGQGWNRTLLVIDKVPCIAGLAASGSRLLVCDSQAHAIRVFDTGTMDEIRRFPFEFPGRIAAESSGAFWVVRTPDPGQTASIIRCDAAGRPMARIDKLESPAALCLDEPRKRLLIADNGPRQILIYDIQADPPKLAGTLGVRGGIYADPPGKAGGLRFSRLTGVAVDAEGNVYVATSGVETSPIGAEIRKFSPQGTLLWRRQGLVGAEGAAPDPESPEDVYTPRQRFRLDYTKDPPTWELAAWTLRPDRYDDPRSNTRFASVQVRRIQGKRILYASDANASRVAFFRFEGDIAVPSGLMVPDSRPKELPPGQQDHVRYVWRDGNGDGKIQPEELTVGVEAEPRSWDWFVDGTGGLWRGCARSFLFCIPCDGLDSVGNPIYPWEAKKLKGYPMPKPFTGIHGLECYDAPETRYLTGEGIGFRRDPADGGGPGGCLLARQDVEAGYRWLVPTDTAIMTRAFSVAGDLVFVTDTFKAAIQVYDAETGLRIGIAGPGKPVGYQSGWCDFPRGLRAYRKADGEYLVFNEEDWKAKVMLYRIRCGLKEVGSQPITPKQEARP